MSAARRRDVLAMSAAAAHADAERGVLDRDAAPRYATSRRSHARWREEGPPPLREFGAYYMASNDPFRIEAHVKSLMKQRALRRRPTPDLIADYHELRAREKAMEGADNANDVTPGLGWLERAAAKERDAAVEEELAAIMREFAARGITEAEVLGHGR